MSILTAYTTEVLDGKGFNLYVPFPETYLLDRQGITECEVYLHDGRSLSPAQRRKIFAMVKDITSYVSGLDKQRRAEREILCSLQLLYLIDQSDAEQVRRQLTYNYCQLCNIDLFSLSNRSSNTIDMSTARDFIDWLVELSIVHGIPCIDTLINRCEDVGRYLCACLMHKRCAICGKKADLHHVDAVGAGRNRKEILHLGMKALPLCRDHHREAHNLGKNSFESKYHISGVVLDEPLCKALGLKAA